MPYPTMLTSAPLTFGGLLKALRKAAGMTQRDLAAALGYSDSQISGLEKDQRPPDLDAVMQRFAPALGLQDQPATIARLIEQAFAARGERPPASLSFQRTLQVALQTGPDEPAKPLPSLPTALIGRTGELNQLCNRLLGHSGRLLTLVGPPGIGKTTLALAMAARLQLHYADGAVFVPLAAISDPTLLAATILTALGSSDLNPPQSKLIAFLRHKNLLLVLDNLEQISAAAPFIAELVAECPKLSILATSRERLHLRAEQRFQVPPLDLASAIELFVQRAQAVAAHFLCTPQNQATLEAICHRLDGLPLAIELCAAQIDLLAPSQLLTQLQERRLDLLVNGAQDLPPRQRTLRTAIGSSYSLLTESERLLLRTLGVFVGGFALPEVTAVASDRLEPASVQSTLHALIGKSLVRAEPLPSGEQRFLLLETICEFALEQMRVQGEEETLRQRHYAAYLHLFRTGDNHFRGPEDAAWLARLKPEQDNLRAALQWALTEAHYADAAWLMNAVCYFWVLCGYGYEEARWLARLLPHRQMLAPDLRLAILLTFYRAAFALEEFQPMDRYMHEIMQLLEGCSHKLLHATAWCFRVWTISDVAQATATTEQGIGLAREAPALGVEFGTLADRDFVLAAHLWGYATFLTGQGQAVQAAATAAESLQLFRRRGNRTGIGECLGTLGRLALLRGDLTKAHKFFQEAVTIGRTINYTAMQSEWQALLALTTLYGGDAAEARRLLNESLRRCLDQKNQLLLAQVCTYLAEIALWEREIDEAAQWLAQSLAYHADPHRVTINEVERLFVAARLATLQQQSLRAATIFGVADQAHNQINNAIGGPMRTLADAALATVRATLEPAVFASAFAAGQQMSLAEAFATILTPRPITGMPTKV